MNEVELLLLKEALVLAGNGLEKLMQIESNHPAVAYLLGNFHTSLSFGQKLVEALEKKNDNSKNQ